MSVLDEMLERLKNASDPRERNELAMKAAETGDPRVLAVLIGLIDRPDLSDQRATLVHCLQKYDCSSLFLWLVKLVGEGNWEVAHEAFDLLASLDGADPVQARRGHGLLSNALASCAAEDWRRRLMEDLLAMFD